MPEKGTHVKFKNYERKLKSPFIIYADFESILVSEDNGKQNSEESYTKKYQQHIAQGSGYRFALVDNRFTKPCKTYLGIDGVTILLII